MQVNHMRIAPGAHHFLGAHQNHTVELEQCISIIGSLIQLHLYLWENNDMHACVHMPAFLHIFNGPTEVIAPESTGD